MPESARQRPAPEVKKLPANGSKQKVVAKDIEALSRLLDPDSLQVIMLFGSVARGDETPTSDVDLLMLVDSNESARDLRRKLRQTRLEIRPLVLPANSLLASNYVYPSFIAHLLDEGEVLHGSAKWYELRAALAERVYDESLLEHELRDRSRALRLLISPDRYRHSPVTALAQMYGIAKSVVIVQLLRRGIHEYSWQRAFDEYAKLRPDLADDIDSVKRLRPYYEAVRHRPNARLPEEAISQDKMKLLFSSVAAIAA